MTEGADIKFEDTKLFSLYFHELRWLAHSIQTKSEKLFGEAKVPEEGDVIQVNPELHSLIAAILSDAANLRKLIVTPHTRLGSESGRQFRLRKARAAALRAAIKGIELVELLNSKVRNTLEHFDEYLDEANIAVSEAKAPPSPMAAYNMVLSRMEVFTPPVYPVRLYISSERKFYNMKWSVNIDAMHKEASAVVDRLANSDVFGQMESPGGILVPLADATPLTHRGVVKR